MCHPVYRVMTSLPIAPVAVLVVVAIVVGTNLLVIVFGEAGMLVGVRNWRSLYFYLLHRSTRCCVSEVLKVDAATNSLNSVKGKHLGAELQVVLVTAVEV